MSIRIRFVAQGVSLALPLLISCGGTGPLRGGAPVDASTDSYLVVTAGGVETSTDAAADAAAAATQLDSATLVAIATDASTGCTSLWRDGAAAAVPPADAGVTTVVTEAGSPRGVAVDDTMVYWTDTSADRVMKAPLAGGAATVIADTGTPGPTTIVVDATYVYWVSSGGQRILRCPKDASNCTPFVVGAPFPGIGSIAVDARNVYFADSSGGRILACATTGCRNAPTVIASGLGSPYGVVVDCANVYWADFAPPTGSRPDTSVQIMKCAVTGCGNAPTVLASDPDPSHLAVDDHNIYWTSWGSGTMGSSLWKCAIDGCGGNPDVVLPSGVDIGADGHALVGPVTDGVHIFFYDVVYSTGVGRLFSCPVSGCPDPPTEMLGGLQNPQDIALGAADVVVAGVPQILAIP